ncbi:hypothetical protein ASG51_14570 [Methylobacterium sp. Leaf465]|uniref:sacsin N-terminal ATP-binding-like domain-containing protein n=1 Tax=Methylobacterium sp. Leaf465 TaxID=1736385 RepID=UPI0006FE9EF6|nr:DUF3883 domain-containing protein [Methylobacterium sp. Leaf465]KQT70267.1 hypothetical protein ASG51_14570 [Methylobacterium sp. Leaf465]
MALVETNFGSAEPSTPEEWADFVREEVRATDAAYLSKPSFLLGHGRGERGTTRDYAGRELLELVQNAADAASEAGAPGRVLIEITADGLVVANTGKPFGISGVRSLMAAHTSDKSQRKVRMIGAKGLGFRALLNWSSEPIVSSGALELRFSRPHAASHAKGLAQGNRELARLLAGSNPEVPVLAFPIVGAASDANMSEAARLLTTRSRALRSEDYETAVAAPFETALSLKRAIAQADEFQPEFLLFVPSLEEIEVRVVGRPALRWRRTYGEGDTVILEAAQAGTSVEQRWSCYRRSGDIKDGLGKAGYELAIALRNGEQAAGCLHTYFPTDLRLPFPCLFHATLELDSNRKALNALSSVNEAVLQRLASFFAEILETVARRRIHDPIALLTPQSDFPRPLEVFKREVFAAAAGRRIVPTMKGGRVTAAETSLGPTGYEEFFPRRLFGDLALSRRPSDRSVFDALGIRPLNLRKALSVIRSADLSIKERAFVVAGMARHLPKEFHDRRLLVDAQGRPFGTNNTCFTDPTTRRPPALPAWARAKFMDAELWKLLVGNLPGPPSSRIQQLSGFGIQTFSVDGIITSLRAQAATVLARRRTDPDRVRRELLQALYNVFQGEGRKNSYPAGLLWVRCQDGSWRDVRSAYISAHYSKEGGIVAALYAKRPELLIDSPEANGLVGPRDDLARFLRWVGAHDWPKFVSEPLPADLRPVVLGALPERFVVADDFHRDTIARDQMAWGDTYVHYETLEGLRDILRHAPCEAILTWLASDLRVTGVFHTRLKARTGRKQHRSYQGPLPDLFRHVLRTVEWLRTMTEERVAPRDAMMSPGRLAEIFPVPAPHPQGGPFGMTRELWVKALFNAGVPRALADLEEARVFALLGSLRKRELPTELIRRVYNQILDLDDFDVGRAPAEAKAFLDTGWLQVRRGGTVDWAPVKQTYYMDRDNIPAAARDTMALIDLPSRRSTSDVQERFGALPLSRQRLRMSVVERHEERGAIDAVLRRRWALTLPYLRAHRRASNADASTFRPIERLDLVTCTYALVELDLEGASRRAALEPWKHVVADDELIVVVDPLASEADILLLAAEAIGDGVAERLGLQSGSEFTKLLSAPSDGMRAVQLRRMLTHRSAEEIEILMSELEPEPGGAAPHGVDADLLAKALAQTSTPLASAANSHMASSPPTAANVPKLKYPLGPMTAVTTEEMSLPNPPSGSAFAGSVGVRIGGPTGPLGAPRDPDRPADAETWAAFFETSDGRYPLPVSMLQGKGSFGCDILSFKTAEDRTTFRYDTSKIALVARFIEVKSGGVRLVTNEIAAAQTHGSRYFIYRIQFHSDDRQVADLTFVSDPLAHSHALARECEVQIDKISSRRQIRLGAIRSTIDEAGREA